MSVPLQCDRCYRDVWVLVVGPRVLGERAAASAEAAPADVRPLRLVKT